MGQFFSYFVPMNIENGFYCKHYRMFNIFYIYMVLLLSRQQQVNHLFPLSQHFKSFSLKSVWSRTAPFSSLAAVSVPVGTVYFFLQSDESLPRFTKQCQKSVCLWQKRTLYVMLLALWMTCWWSWFKTVMRQNYLDIDYLFELAINIVRGTSFTHWAQEVWDH